MKRRQLKGLMTGIWIANALICLLAAGVYAFTAAPRRARPAAITPSVPRPVASRTPEPSITPIPPPRSGRPLRCGRRLHADQV